MCESSWTGPSGYVATNTMAFRGQYSLNYESEGIFYFFSFLQYVQLIHISDKMWLVPDFCKMELRSQGKKKDQAVFF